MNRLSLTIALYAFGYATPVMAEDLAGALLGISVRASVEVSSRVSTEASSYATTHESAGSGSGCRQHGHYDECMILDRHVAAALVREAYAGSGATLLQFASALATTPTQLMRAIVTSLPPKPTAGQLERLLAFVGPGL